MKRSERIQRHAIQELLMSISTFSAAIAAGVWAVSAWLTSPAGGLVVFIIALTGLCLASSMMATAIQLFRMADHEYRLEMERAIRPRL